MSSITPVAKKFFEACETGQGWEGCKAYCAADATFSAQAAPLLETTTLAAYADWMERHGLLRFEVADAGPGIPPDELPKLFNRFYQGKPPLRRMAGSGLGLVIAKAIVEQHGGRIGVESTPGEGSTFWFELPAS